jgi:hypothetical protein
MNGSMCLVSELFMGRLALVILMGAISAPLLADSPLATKYQPLSRSGGFDETALTPTVFRVTFVGNGFTDSPRAVNYALLRSAEVTLRHGYRYFVIVDAREVSKVEGWSTPSTAQTSVQATTYGNVTRGSATTSFSGGQSIVFEMPRATNTIVCFSERPNIGGLVYDAQFLRDSLRQKYGLGGGSSEGDAVTSYVCGASTCSDKRISRIRELMGEGVTLDDAYVKATEEAEANPTPARQ